MTTKTSTQTVYPTLTYRDAAAAIDWLVTAFGFEKLMAVPGEGGGIVHAELRYGDGVMMLGSVRDDAYGRLASPGGVAPVQSLYVVVDDPDAHYQRAKAAGARIVLDLKDADYGSRGYTALDIEGNVWSFGTYRPEV
ncbi:MAG: VOC family protein [Dehalococcoidia bacterium]